MRVQKEAAIWEHLDDATEKGIKDSTQIGEEKGEMTAKIAVAKEMLADKMDINTIAKFTELSIEEITRLQKESDFLS